MKAALLTRLKRLETVQAIESEPEVELQIGYLKKLPLSTPVSATRSQPDAYQAAHTFGRRGSADRQKVKIAACTS